MKCAKCGKNRRPKYMVQISVLARWEHWCNPCINRIAVTARPANTAQFPLRTEDIMQGEIR